MKTFAKLLFAENSRENRAADRVWNFTRQLVKLLCFQIESERKMHLFSPRVMILFVLLSFAALNHAGGDQHHHHHHKQIDVSEAAQQPTVSIRLHQDATSGWNLEVITEHFTFTPQNTNQDHVPGTGHAHVYVDGVKLGRLYGHWMHLTGLEPGAHTIKVTLNSNDHQDYAIGGVVIGDEVTITQP